MLFSQNLTLNFGLERAMKGFDMKSNGKTDKSAMEIEKQKAAMSSVVAAVFLTLMKIVVGISTNSIGILSEAAHSGLDLVAAAVTYFAVKMSDVPPDEKHHYGHGKVENLSALIETILLFVTCVWIVYEACVRIFVSNEHVEASIWSFLVMGISILVDFTRSRMLLRMAKKHNSQALEADALHFSTDIISSFVVLVGLGGIFVGEKLNVHPVWKEYLLKADAVAALAVAGIVVYVSIKMGKKAVDALLDATPVDISEEIRDDIRSLPGVLNLQSLRIRQSGPTMFVDMALQITRSISLDDAHVIAKEAEKIIKSILPNADTIVHIEPVSAGDLSIIETIRDVAAKNRLAVHGVRVHQVRDTLYLEMHVEVPEQLNLEDAHGSVTSFEQELYNAIPTATSIVTHIEPVGEGAALCLSQPIGSAFITSEVISVCKEAADVLDCHDVTILNGGDRPSISFHCRMDSKTPMIYAHKVAAALEASIHLRVPGLDRIVVHLEPAK